MHPPRPCCAALVLSIGLLAPLATAHADPFEPREIPLPMPDSWDLAVADFDGDGLPDVAALNSYGPAHFECYPPPAGIACGNDRMFLSVALNEGMGYFAPALTVPTMCLPWTIVAGDFNADGHQDVIVGNRGSRDAFGVCWQPSISYFPGDGDGGFSTDQHLTVPDEPVDMATGDFDGDGVPEAAVAFGIPGKVQLFGVTLTGVFTSRAQWYAPAPLAAIATGDLDDDFDDEIIVAYDTGEVSIIDFGAGGVPVLVETCTFTASGPASSALVIEDFTLDLAPDIALGRRGGTWSLVILLRRAADGSYCQVANAITTVMDGSYAGRLATADLNADGIPDLATTDESWRLRSLTGDGAGHFAVSDPIGIGSSCNGVVSADLNGDWVDDLAISGTNFFGSNGMAWALINDAPISSLMGLVMAGDEIDWNGVFDAQSYDIVVGDLATLASSGGDFTLATMACWIDDWTFTSVPLAADPAPGSGWFIIGRPVFGGGPGTYDEWGTSQVGLRDAEINASADACP